MKIYSLLLFTGITLMSSLAFSEPWEKLGEITFPNDRILPANEDWGTPILNQIVPLNDQKVAVVFYNTKKTSLGIFSTLFVLDFKKDISEVQEEVNRLDNVLLLKKSCEIYFFSKSQKLVIVSQGASWRSTSVAFLDLETMTINKDTVELDILSSIRKGDEINTLMVFNRCESGVRVIDI